jgi:hypothetical protein
MCTYDVIVIILSNTCTIKHRWGCPRGRGCDFAHGEEELKGDEATATKKRKADSEKAQVRTSLQYSIHTLLCFNLNNCLAVVKSLSCAHERGACGR